MSFNHSNPLLADPSIVSISDKDAGSNSTHKQHYEDNDDNPADLLSKKSISLSNLDPGNALSKLLDSAMAHAAKESTPVPEFSSDADAGVDAKTGGEVDGGAGANEQPSRTSSHLHRRENSFKGKPNKELSAELLYMLENIPEKKKGIERIYTVNQLLKVRDDGDIADVLKDLPGVAFWRLKPQREVNSRYSINNGEHSGSGGGAGNGSSTYKNNKGKFKRHLHETWERGKTSNENRGSHSHHNRHGFNKANDLDSLSSEKISELLGEGNEEPTPEWGIGDDVFDGKDGADNMSMLNMGHTVEDFEKWKSQMKLEERRRNGDIIDIELEQQKLEKDGNDAAANAGNEVDNFFSFIKPPTQENNVKELESGELEQVSSQNQGATNASRSSRFSSFFQQPGGRAQPPQQTQEQGQSPVQATYLPASVQSHTATGRTIAPPPGLSKFFGGAPQPSQTSQPSQPSQPSQTQSSSSVPTLSNVQERPSLAPQGSLGTSNDNFFLSLLKKKESGQQTSSPGVGHLTPDSVKNTPTLVVDQLKQGSLEVRVNEAAKTSDQSQSSLSQNFNKEEESEQSTAQPQNQLPQLYGQGRPSHQQPPPPWMNPQQQQQQQLRSFPPGFDPSMLQHRQFAQQAFGPASQQQQSQSNRQLQHGSPNNQRKPSGSLQALPDGVVPPPFPNIQRNQQMPMPPPPPPGMFPNGFPPPPSQFQPHQSPNFPQPGHPMMPPGFMPGMMRMGGPPPPPHHPGQFGNHPNAMIPPMRDGQLPPGFQLRQPLFHPGQLPQQSPHQQQQQQLQQPPQTQTQPQPQQLK